MGHLKESLHRKINEVKNKTLDNNVDTKRRLPTPTDFSLSSSEKQTIVNGNPELKHKDCLKAIQQVQNEGEAMGNFYLSRSLSGYMHDLIKRSQKKNRSFPYGNSRKLGVPFLSSNGYYRFFASVYYLDPEKIFKDDSDAKGWINFGSAGDFNPGEDPLVSEDSQYLGSVLQENGVFDQLKPFFVSYVLFEFSKQGNVDAEDTSLYFKIIRGYDSNGNGGFSVVSSNFDQSEIKIPLKVDSLNINTTLSYKGCDKNAALNLDNLPVPMVVHSHGAKLCCIFVAPENEDQVANLEDLRFVGFAGVCDISCAPSVNNRKPPPLQPSKNKKPSRAEAAESLPQAVAAVSVPPPSPATIAELVNSGVIKTIFQVINSPLYDLYTGAGTADAFISLVKTIPTSLFTWKTSDSLMRKFILVEVIFTTPDEMNYFNGKTVNGRAGLATYNGLNFALSESTGKWYCFCVLEDTDGDGLYESLVYSFDPSGNGGSVVPRASELAGGWVNLSDNRSIQLGSRGFLTWDVGRTSYLSSYYSLSKTSDYYLTLEDCIYANYVILTDITKHTVLSKTTPPGSTLFPAQ